MTKSFQFSLAPDQLWQAINPWSFYNQGAQLGFVNINLGQTAHPEIEQKVLDEVGSYGKQLGRIGDALEVLIDHARAQGPQPRGGRRAIPRASSPKSARSAGTVEGRRLTQRPCLPASHPGKLCRAGHCARCAAGLALASRNAR